MNPAGRPWYRRLGPLGSDRGGAVGCRAARGAGGERRARPALDGRGFRGAPADGGASAIEFAMLTPIMFFLIFGTVQVAMYSFAQDVAKAAAQAGARTARAEADVDPAGWQSKARQTAAGYVSSLAGDGILGNTTITAGYVEGGGVPAGTVVRVEVRGEAVSIVPALQMSVTASSEGPVERFVPDGG